MMLRYDKKLNNCESVNKLPGVPRRRGTTCGWTEGSEWPQATTASTDDCSGGDPPNPTQPWWPSQAARHQREESQ